MDKRKKNEKIMLMYTCHPNEKMSKLISFPSISDWSSLSTVMSDLEVSDNHLDQLKYALHHMKEE